MFRKLRLGLVYELARITGHWGTELGCGCIFVCSGIRSTALLMLWVLIPPPPTASQGHAREGTAWAACNWVSGLFLTRSWPYCSSSA